jgi:hypothetical protein
MKTMKASIAFMAMNMRHIVSPATLQKPGGNRML